MTVIFYHLFIVLGQHDDSGRLSSDLDNLIKHAIELTKAASQEVVQAGEDKLAFVEE